jgi:VWFA-related protein
MGTKLTAFACILVLVVSAALSLGQDFQLRTKVELVVVPVSVRDGNGSLVRNLKQDDFTVLEDGNPQTISNFSVDPQPLSAVILVDTALGGGELRRLSLVSGTLFSQFKEVDEVELYGYDKFVTRLTDFTNNTQVIAKSFEPIKLVAETKAQDLDIGRAIEPSPLRWILDRTQIGTAGAPANPVNTPPTQMPPPGPARQPVSVVLQDAMFTAVTDLEKRPNERRKIIILISDGLVVGTNEHSQPEISSHLLRNNVQVFGVGTDQKILEHMTALNAYAKNTGGAVFDGSKEQTMAEAFGQIVDQAREQYIIGYLSNNEIKGGRPVVRKIEVKVNEKKLKVTHRPNYLQYPT